MEEKQKDVMNALENWISSVATLDPKKVVKHYAKDGVLWGTVSRIIRPGHDLIHDYFVEFCARKPVDCIVKEPNIRIYGDIAINSGYYTFVFDNNGEKVRADARYSFVYQLQDGKWMILDHHSSFIPEG
jgi:uncharacterized protein (TIGR02246 family)